MLEIGLRFPGVFQRWITFPCGQVLVVFAVAMVSYNSINFVLFFGINHVRRGLGEVGSMCVGFSIRGKEGGMEDIMDFPCGR